MKLKPMYILIAFAALAQGVMWVNVFKLFHLGALTYIGGFPAGVAIVGIIVMAANGLPRVQSKRARQAGWAFLILVMLIEPVVLGIVNWWIMPPDFKELFVSYVVAGGASLTISLVLVMGALVDRSLLPAEKPARPARKPKEAKNEPIVAEPEPAKASFSCSVVGCNAKPFGSQSALNAHQRKHKKVAGYMVSFEPVIDHEKE